jgi:Zn-dependent protease
MTTKSENKVSLWAIIGKFGGKLLSFFPKILKAAKLIKVGLFLATFASYSVLFSWKFAALILLTVGFHESCHVFAMRRVGIPTKGFYFLPFLGGVALASAKPKTFAQWCFVALAGPAGGFLLALITAAIYFTTHTPLFGVAASWMALINLFNLFPIAPLDGGHVIKAIALSLHKKAGVVFLAIIYALCIVALGKLHIELFVFFGSIGLIELLFGVWDNHRQQKEVNKLLAQRIEVWDKAGYIWYEGAYAPDKFIQHPTPEQRELAIQQHKSHLEDKLIEQHPEDLTKSQIWVVSLSYVALAAILLVLMHMTASIPGADIASEFLKG